MDYEGLFCKMRFDGSTFFYEANKPLSTALFWSSFNKRVEVPISAIVEVSVASYLPFSKGLVLKIRSGYRWEKIKTLKPMNITAVPDHVIKALEEQVQKNIRQSQSLSA